MLIFKRHTLAKLYFPGLISLICLPLLCIGYLGYENSFQKIGVTTVTWFDNAEFNEMLKDIHKKIDINTSRNFAVITFNGNAGHNAFEQARLNSLISELSNKKDSVNAVKILFEKGAIYKDFVSAVDAGYQHDEKNISTMLLNDKVYIWYIPPSKATYIGGNLGNDLIYTKPIWTLTDRVELEIKKAQGFIKLLVPFWPCFLILLMMVVLSVSGKNKIYFTSGFNFTREKPNVSIEN